MKREYTVTAIMRTVLQTNIVANSQEEADAMARNLDGGVFSEMEGEGSWEIEGVEDIGEAEEE